MSGYGNLERMVSLTSICASNSAPVTLNNPSVSLSNDGEIDLCFLVARIDFFSSVFLDPFEILLIVFGPAFLGSFSKGTYHRISLVNRIKIVIFADTYPYICIDFCI
jgi:hypothetical protein